ncbi:HEAT repeat domain-containing protein [Bythopirellula polymerisocia]|uniref:Prenyltransferase and squalene oxidase repeat protein n=1 Tax=Bythopirellula polymerisocia TaxID=2528003 RepID=A0A5C6CUZ5_9BACT|nr:HEAT repeat domain-containing protein [Bythopirellula polymerisocia]TWU27251.1 Prenyltransferase and squalene oxidase repeat protein [Bythopirellula polymerisocia]
MFGVTSCALNDLKPLRGRHSGYLSVVMLLLLAPYWTLSKCQAVTPDSPEVRELVNRGLKFLESHTDERLGGRCLVALSFVKTGASPEHPRIKEAVAACEATTAEKMRNDSVYSNGLAIIFLAELDPVKYRSLIERFAGALANRQKPHGGWGYEVYQTGDTSQTQYAILSYWELMQIGLAPSVKSVESAANWLLRTQDPSGSWGYQGKDPGDFKLIEQTDTTVSMLAAGLGSTLIAANILGTMQPGEDPDADTTAKEELPSALQEAKSEVKKIRTLSGGNLDREQVLRATEAGNTWFGKNFNKNLEAEYPYYTLYSIERYKSFEDFLAGNVDEEPSWYQTGYEYIKKKQKKDGSVTSPAESPCATAFAILFLIRSTQQSIKASLGEGTLVGGRGLSANLARMKLQKGRLVKEKKPTEIDNFLSLLESTAGPELDALLSESSGIDVNNISPEEIRHLEQLVKTGSPEVRLMAVEGLASLRSLDYVPSLLYALTDPDKRVVRAARDGLQFVSRRFHGFGPDDNFTDKERYDSLEQWKNWYRSVRPNAPIAP